MAYAPLSCPTDDRFLVAVDRADPGSPVYWQMGTDAPAHDSGLQTSDLPDSDPEAAQRVRGHVIAGWVLQLSDALFMAMRRLERYRVDRIPANLLASWTSMQKADALLQLDEVEHASSNDWRDRHQRVRVQVVAEMLAYAEAQLSADRKDADTAEKVESHEELGYAVLAEYGNAEYLLKLAALGKPLPRHVPNMKFTHLRARVAARYGSSGPTVSRAWAEMKRVAIEDLDALQQEVEHAYASHVKASRVKSKAAAKVPQTKRKRLEYGRTGRR